jgi:hypothetical protein
LLQQTEAIVDSFVPTGNHKPSLLEEAEAIVASLAPKSSNTKKGPKRLGLLEQAETLVVPTSGNKSSLLEKAEGIVARLRPQTSVNANTKSKAESSTSKMSNLSRQSSLRKKKVEDDVKTAGNSNVIRKPSLSKKNEEDVTSSPSSLVRRSSLRRAKEASDRIAQIQASPSIRRKEFGLKDMGDKAQKRENNSSSETPTLRRKNSIRHTLESLRKGASDNGEGKEEKKTSNTASLNRNNSLRRSVKGEKREENKQEGTGKCSRKEEEKGLLEETVGKTASSPATGQSSPCQDRGAVGVRNRLRGPALSREPSFDCEDSREQSSSRVARNKTITINPNNSVNIEIKNAKKSVPPSPAASKKTHSNTKLGNVVFESSSYYSLIFFVVQIIFFFLSYFWYFFFGCSYVNLI